MQIKIPLGVTLIGGGSAQPFARPALVLVAVPGGGSTALLPIALQSVPLRVPSTLSRTRLPSATKFGTEEGRPVGQGSDEHTYLC